MKSVERIALELAMLPALAEHDEPEAAQSCVARLQGLLAESFWQFQNEADSYSALGNAGDTITIRRPPFSANYASAHQAALDEANLFLDLLWFHLDSQRQRESRETDAICNGMPAVLVSDHWERAKTGILELLPRAWREDFAMVRSRIQWERGRIHGKKTHTHDDTDSEVIGERQKRFVSPPCPKCSGKAKVDHTEGRMRYMVCKSKACGYRWTTATSA